MHNIAERIAQAAAVSGRDPSAIRLLAVSKTWPVESLREAAAAGQRAFGESYVQEAIDKVDALAGEGLEWHFIGPLQSNKTRPVASAFAWLRFFNKKEAKFLYRIFIATIMY